MTMIACPSSSIAGLQQRGGKKNQQAAISANFARRYATPSSNSSLDHSPQRYPHCRK
jgi:hypothetical protein